MEEIPDQGVVNHRKRISKCDKGNVLMQTVDVNRADGHPDISMIFFFLTEPSKQK